MQQIKTKSKELNKVFDELNDIFLNFKGVNAKNTKRLEKLGFRIVKIGGNHPKMYIDIKGTTHVITLCCSPSDCYTGRQILREIRRVYERN